MGLLDVRWWLVVHDAGWQRYGVSGLKQWMESRDLGEANVVAVWALEDYWCGRRDAVVLHLDTSGEATA